MYYKVIKDKKVIDVLDRLVFLNYQEKHDRMQFCDESKAQAIFSSDGEYIWHEKSLYNLPAHVKYDTVELEEIDIYEYDRLKALNGKTPEQVIDMFVLNLVNGDKTQFEKSLKRLCDKNLVEKEKVTELYMK